MMCQGVVFCIYPVWGFLSFLNLWLDFFDQFWKIPGQYFKYYFPSLSSLSFLDSNYYMVCLCSVYQCFSVLQFE